MMSLFFFVFIILLGVFFSNSTSFMNSLLYLESFSLIIYLVLFYYTLFFFSCKILMFYLVFIATESSVGLSLLVKLIKMYGTNNFRSMALSLF